MLLCALYVILATRRYDGLPVVVVDSWDQVTAELLERVEREYPVDSYDANLPNLDLRTWVKRIREDEDGAVN